MPQFWTHKGWHFFCPCYFANLDSEDGPVVDVRHWVFYPLWVLAGLFESTIIFFLSLTDPDYEPAFRFYITGELNPEEYPIPWGDDVCRECGCLKDEGCGGCG